MKKITLQYAKTPNSKVYFESLLNGILISLCLIVVCVFLFFTTHSMREIKGQSMEPGIASLGQSCFVYNNTTFTYGDIVVSSNINKGGEDIIKRVIAMQGDKVGFIYNLTPEDYGFSDPYYQTVIIKAGTTTPTYLNETYLYHGITDKQEQNDLLKNTAYSFAKFSALENLQLVDVGDRQIYMLEIPENYIFLLGDNRKVSLDCSQYGPMPIKNVQGRVDQIFDSSTSPIWIAIKSVFGFKNSY